MQFSHSNIMLSDIAMPYKLYKHSSKHAFKCDIKISKIPVTAVQQVVFVVTQLNHINPLFPVEQL